MLTTSYVCYLYVWRSQYFLCLCWYGSFWFFALHLLLIFVVAPFSVQAVSDVAETKGRTAKLACAVDGSPKPEVTWKKDGRNLTSDVRYRRV